MYDELSGVHLDHDARVGSAAVAVYRRHGETAVAIAYLQRRYSYKAT